MNISIDGKLNKKNFSLETNAQSKKNSNVQSSSISSRFDKSIYSKGIHPELLKTYSGSFGYNIEKHLTQGVSFLNKDGKLEASVKMFTFKDVQKVEIQIVKAAAKIEDVLLTNYRNIIPEDKSRELNIIELENKGGGQFEKIAIITTDLAPGDRYRFKITRQNGKESFITDLYAKQLLNPFENDSKLSNNAKIEMKKNSLIQWPVAYDDNTYKPSQSHLDWVAGKNPNKVSVSNSKLTNTNALRIIQVHLGTFTEEGNFESAIKKLDAIKEMGFNAIEIMPHGYFHEVNWGYDPNFPFASQYGGNDAFKKFCDEAHQKELNIIVDLVNNHYSMDNPEILREAGPYEHPDPNMALEFGPRLNYTQEGKEGVRDWRINEALHWLNSGADSIRFDLTDYTGSDGFLTQLNHEIKHHFPDAPTFAEDNREEITNSLPKKVISNDPNIHNEQTKKLQNDEYGFNNKGFTHRWHFNYSPHAINSTVLHPFDRQMDNLHHQILNAQHQLKAIFTHDEIGKQEADGNDIAVKIIINKLFGQDVMPNNGEDRGKIEYYWKISRAIRELTNINETGGQWPCEEKQFAKEITKSGDDPNDFNGEKYGVSDYEKGGFGLHKYISKAEFTDALNSAKTLNKALMGFLFSQPGPKMIFQSFDKPDKRFAFFRKMTEYFYKTFNKNTDSRLSQERDWETIRKGHRLDADEIINEAKLSKIGVIGNYTEDALKDQANMRKLIKRLNKIGSENPALQNGAIKNVITHYDSALTAVHSQKGNNEIFAITHFGDDKNYPNYNIYFPPGKWEEIVNTNAEEFGGSGEFLNTTSIDATKEQNKMISVPKSSTMIFKKIKDETAKK